MKKPASLLLLLGLVMTSNCAAQEISRFVFSSQGGVDKVWQFDLEWSLGDVFTETINSQTHHFTQGFHQPLLINKATLTLERFSSAHSVFPNPTENVLFLTSTSGSDIQTEIKLFDISGRVILAVPFAIYENAISLDLSDLLPGIYVLHVFAKDTRERETFRIVKI